MPVFWKQFEFVQQINVRYSFLFCNQYLHLCLPSSFLILLLFMAIDKPRTESSSSLVAMSIKTCDRSEARTDSLERMGVLRQSLIIDFHYPVGTRKIERIISFFPHTKKVPKYSILLIGYV